MGTHRLFTRKSEVTLRVMKRSVNNQTTIDHRGLRRTSLDRRIQKIKRETEMNTASLGESELPDPQDSILWMKTRWDETLTITGTMAQYIHNFTPSRGTKKRRRPKRTAGVRL